MRFPLFVLVFLTAVKADAVSLMGRQSAVQKFPPTVGVYDQNYATCANANWPPPGPGDNVGSVIKPQLPDEELQAALAEVSADNIKKIISKLVSFGTRHTLSQQNDTERGIGAARDWIASEYRRYAEESGGRMTVTTPSYIQEATTDVPEAVKISNVQASLKGTSDPDRYYLTMGHYDTRLLDILNWSDDQPGANDDASGVAGECNCESAPDSSVASLLTSES